MSRLGKTAVPLTICNAAHYLKTGHIQMRKAQEIRNLDDGQLEAEVQKLRAEIFKLRTKDSLKQLDKTHEIKLTRRELALVLTVITERTAEKAKNSAQTEENK